VPSGPALGHLTERLMEVQSALTTEAPWVSLMALLWVRQLAIECLRRLVQRLGSQKAESVRWLVLQKEL
jgi:hypothetical protein